MVGINKIISQYIVKNTSNHFIRILLVFIGLIFVNNLFLVLKETTGSLMLITEVIQIVTLKLTSQLSILIPIVLFFSVLTSFNSLKSKSELVILNNIGFSRINLFQLIWKIVFFLLLFNLILNFLLMPIINKNIQSIKNKVLNDPSRIVIEDSTLNYFNNANILIYVDSTVKNKKFFDQSFDNFFLIFDDGNKSEIITAKSGSKTNLEDELMLNLSKGQKISGIENSQLFISNFDKASINLSSYLKEDTGQVNEINQELENLSLLNLYYTNSNYGDGIIFWRVITVNSVLFLSLFAFIFINNRKSKRDYYQLVSFVFLIIYFSILISIKSKIELGNLGLLDGLLLSHFFIIFILVLFYFKEIYRYLYVRQTIKNSRNF